VHRVIAFVAFEEQFVSATLSTLAAIAIGSGLFWTINKISSGRWIGDGDYRLGLAIALYLGSPLLTWLALFFGSVFGLALSLPVIAKSHSKMKLKIPFGPFLIVGLFISYLVGQQLLDWYSSLFLKI
jgi:prepilin signal peptidase PulO-like enzyme (type II secretory pathway)